MSDAAFLALQGLHAGYGKTAVLNGIDLLLTKGEFVSLLGPNGAGKSTLLRTVFGLTSVLAGAVRFKGADITGAKPGTLPKVARCRNSGRRASAAAA